MDFIESSIADYSEQHTSPESTILKELNRETYARVLMPRMLSGHLQGRMLSMISHMIRPAHILEIGTYTGYSALCLAEGLAPNGVLDTIDINDELKTLVHSYIHKAGMENKIITHYGDASKIIPTIRGPFDLVFIDADKINYLTYYKMLFENVRPGGFILADNVLWSGKILEDPTKADKDTKALQEFNEMIMKDERVEKVLLTVRDGVMVIRKRTS
jgi:predicted O-methyltransferase YrrM